MGGPLPRMSTPQSSPPSLTPLRTSLPSLHAFQGRHGFNKDVKGEEWVYIDPHILTTPAMADIDGDGQEELVVPVSYFFDK